MKIYVSSILLSLLLFSPAKLNAKPHYLKSAIELPNLEYQVHSSTHFQKLSSKGQPVMRVYIEHQLDSESFQLSSLEKEFSGTTSLIARSKSQEVFGSYKAELYDLSTGKAISYASVGTGSYYRLLSRGMSFRFPWKEGVLGVRLFAEHPISGKMEKVLDQVISSDDFIPSPEANVEVRILRKAPLDNPLVITIYSEGYLSNRRAEFFEHAQKVIPTLEKYNVPGLDQIEFRAAFYPSNEELGSSKDFSPRLPEKDSFLGLFYPYWTNFGRWYHVIYPTRENKFRRSLGQVAYDYPIILADNSGYWGVGNYNSHTAIPARTYYFPYLLIHEFGHFMGLNEEYEEPAPNITELSFAPEIDEPWSQNTTFLRNGKLKWKKHVHPDTPIPTPKSYWNSVSKKVGAYKGGYSSPPHLNHKPGFSCVMSSGGKLCPVCHEAIENKIKFDRTGNL